MTANINIDIKYLLKRMFDLIICCFCLILFLPILILTWLLVRRWLGSPVIFQQQRPGLNGRVFTIFKFRTMSDTRDGQGKLLDDEFRLTPLGRFLRATSFDELPELFNVIKGDMSLVGPRPLLTEYLDRYSVEQARRHDMLPGITGWAQINGRNDLSWEDKFKLDIWYIDNWSLGLDIRILALTAVKIFRREGITQPGHATAEKFRGTVIKNEK